MNEDKGLGLKSWLGGPKRRGAKVEGMSDKLVSLDSNRVAVLPFANMSPDPNDEYFADGITEEIISTLSKIPYLEVISRTSVMQYRKISKPIAEVAKELHVGTILEGSVRKAGSKIRIAVQMIDPTKDRHLWAESYDREFQDVFVVQSDIAKRVAESTKTSVREAVRVKIEKIPTRNMTAYANYLKGIYLVHTAYPASTSDPIKHLQDAINEDPEFSEAYAALGNAYVSFAGDFIPAREAFEKAESLVEKALELEENSSDAHLAKGNLAMQYHLDWELAENEFKRAIDSNPSNANARTWYSILLRAVGNMEGALEEAQRANELDPLSTWSVGHLSECFSMKRDWTNSIACYEKMVRLEPERAANRLGLSRCYFRAGKVKEAQEALQAARKLNMGTFDKIDLARTLALLGSKEEARGLLLEIEGGRQKQFYSPTRLASAYSVLGETERALALLEEDFEGDKFAFLLNYARPDFDPVREDPRFLSLRAKLSLPKRNA